MMLFALLMLTAVVATEAVFRGGSLPYNPDLTNPEPDFPFGLGSPLSKRQVPYYAPYRPDLTNPDPDFPFRGGPVSKRQMLLDPATEAWLARLRAKALKDSSDKAQADDSFVSKRVMLLDPASEAWRAEYWAKALKDSSDKAQADDSFVSKRRLSPAIKFGLDRLRPQDGGLRSYTRVPPIALPPTLDQYVDALKKGAKVVYPDNLVNLNDQFGIVSKRDAQ